MPKKTTTKPPASKVKTAKKKVAKKEKVTKEVKVKVSAPNDFTKDSADAILKRFYQVMGDLRSQQESETFLLDFLTESERMTFAKRLAIGMELQSGKSYDTIKKEFGVSSATISSVAEMMKKPGLKLAFQKVSTDTWADQMSEKFFQFFKVN